MSDNVVEFPTAKKVTPVGEPLDIEQALHAGVALVCTYETYAIVSGKVPTVSTLCGRYPALVPVILIGLGIHLVYDKVKKWWSQ